MFFFFFQAEDGIRDAQESRGLGDVYKRQDEKYTVYVKFEWTAGQRSVTMDPSDTIFALQQKIPELLEQFPEDVRHFETEVRDACRRDPEILKELSLTVGRQPRHPDDKLESMANASGLINVDVFTKVWEEFKQMVMQRVAITGSLGLSALESGEESKPLPGMDGILYGVEPTSQHKLQVPDKWQEVWQVDYDVQVVLDIKDDGGDQARWRMVINCVKSNTVAQVRERAEFFLEKCSRGQKKELYDALGLTQGFQGNGHKVSLHTFVPRNAPDWDHVATDETTMGELVQTDWSAEEEAFPLPKYRTCQGEVKPVVMFFVTDAEDPMTNLGFWEQEIETINKVKPARLNNLGFFGFDARASGELTQSHSV
eukprot:TRINITY_DN44879_c0_g1_i1.p1 TRINITY_DN44879_c0_g1~~TRINITY_DN44879_c0_g1_i1.p1  ORF type:complete len:369 (-),score=114.99 TRINITY_DN44879_c0_g1_i1:428-1534(-)